MGLYRRGEIYWYSIQFQGRRIQKSLKTSNRKLAEKLYAKVLADIVEGRYFKQQKAASVSFRQLVDAYMRKYRKERGIYTVKRLLPFFGDMMLADISAEQVESYILERAEEGAAANTIYLEFSLGRRMFNVARKKWKWVSANPFADVTFSELQVIDNARDRWLTVKEEALLMKHATPDYLKDLIIFALHTGCRRGEILSATWRENIDMRNRVVRIKSSKRGMKMKIIPMSDTLYAMLRRRWKVRHISDAVFPYSVDAVKDAFQRAVKKAGLHDLHFHDLRHTFATRLVQSGVDLYVVQKLLGHKSIMMTERYAHHYPESLRPSVKALDECYNSATFPEGAGAVLLAGKGKNPVLSISNAEGSG